MVLLGLSQNWARGQVGCSFSHLAVAFSSAALFGLLSTNAHAQNPDTLSDPLNVPVFESIDENGVDLASGMLRLRGPAITIGSGEEQASVQLEWTGRSWRYLGVPTLTYDDDDNRYFVTYDGVTREFDDYYDNFDQIAPIDGSTLECDLANSPNIVRHCIFTDNMGDVVFFGGIRVFGLITDEYPMQTMLMGNIGIRYIEVHSPRDPVPSLDGRNFGSIIAARGPDRSYNHRWNYITMGGHQMAIETHAHDGQDDDEHYLIPRNTWQTFYDDRGGFWQYFINSDREITTVNRFSGLGDVFYTYTGGHRVQTVTTDAGVWSYSYSDSSTYRTVVVTTPTGRKYSVKAHKDYGYVTEVIEGRQDPNSANWRTTTYNYNSSTRRLTSVVYPEGNSESFLYDSRGNVTRRQQIPKPGSGDPTLTSYASYPPGACADRALCNRPTSTTDPRGGQTDFAYAPTIQATINSPGNGSYVATHQYDFNHGQPVMVEYPAVSGSPDRRTENFTYSYGRLASSSHCEDRASCSGAADEVTTEFSYTNLNYEGHITLRNPSNNWTKYVEGRLHLPYRMRVTSDGETLTTCYDYDTNGRLVRERPPASGSNCSSSLVSAPAFDATQPDSYQPRRPVTFP